MVTEVKSSCTKSVQCCDIVGFFFSSDYYIGRKNTFLSLLKGLAGGSNACVTTLKMKAEVIDVTCMFAVFRMKKKNHVQ